MDLNAEEAASYEYLVDIEDTTCEWMEQIEFALLQNENKMLKAAIAVENAENLTKEELAEAEKVRNVETRTFQQQSKLFWFWKHSQCSM